MDSNKNIVILPDKWGASDSKPKTKTKLSLHGSKAIEIQGNKIMHLFKTSTMQENKTNQT